MNAKMGYTARRVHCGEGALRGEKHSGEDGTDRTIDQRGDNSSKRRMRD